MKRRIYGSRGQGMEWVGKREGEGDRGVTCKTLVLEEGSMRRSLKIWPYGCQAMLAEPAP